jgi:hypothetical protein
MWLNIFQTRRRYSPEEPEIPALRISYLNNDGAGLRNLYGGYRRCRPVYTNVTSYIMFAFLITIVTSLSGDLLTENALLASAIVYTHFLCFAQSEAQTKLMMDIRHVLWTQLQHYKSVSPNNMP